MEISESGCQHNLSSVMFSSASFNNLYNLNKLAMRAPIFFAAIFSFFFLFDHLLVKPFAKPKARYFILHVVFNFWLSITVWSSAMIALLDPQNALYGDNDPTPSSNFYTFTYTHGIGFTDSQIATTAGIASFHCYHAIFFTGIHKEEWIHHIVSCAIVPAIGLNMPFARVVDVSNLGMCGIPGGIDYLLLALQKSESRFAPSRLVQKRISALLNLLVRWPIMLISSYMFLIGWINGTLAETSQNSFVPWLMFVGVVLHTANAAYYAHKVIGNYHVVKFQDNEAKKNKEK